jgi:hypothetical protein
MTSESPLGDSTEAEETEAEDIPELSTEPDNEPVDAPEPEVEDLDQDPEGTEIPEQNKHEE